jgi:hypothetical protein
MFLFNPALASERSAKGILTKDGQSSYQIGESSGKSCKTSLKLIPKLQLNSNLMTKIQPPVGSLWSNLTNVNWDYEKLSSSYDNIFFYNSKKLSWSP